MWVPSLYLKEARATNSRTPISDVMGLGFDPSQVYGRIYSALQQASVAKSSVEDIVALVIDKCSGLLHPLHHEIDYRLDYLEVFIIAIAKLVRFPLFLLTVSVTDAYAGRSADKTTY